MRKIGVILSGCGIYDGAEIHEAVLTLLALDIAGAKAVCLAPNIEQHHVINHLTGEVVAGETRNVLVEAARISHGNITNLKKIDSLHLDALIIIGGYGAVKTLSDYELRGTDCEVLPELTDAIASFFRAGKPIGFTSISPVIAALLLGRDGIELTIGNNRRIVGDIEALGAKNVITPVEEAIVSSAGKIVSTSAYMQGPSIRHVAKGINELVRKVIELC